MKNAYEKLVNKINSYNGEFTLLSEYVERFDSYVEIQHNKCKTINRIQAHNFKGKCPACARNSNIGERRFDSRMIAGEFPDFELKSTFINQNTKVKILHKKCGNIFEMTPANFLSGQRCNCLNKHKNKGHEQFSKEFDKISEGKYTLLSKYTNSRGKVLIRHNTCGNEFYMTANDFIINGHRCPKCFKGRITSHEEFIKKLPGYILEDFDIISRYTKIKEKITLKCHICNTEFSILAQQLTRRLCNLP